MHASWKRPCKGRWRPGRRFFRKAGIGADITDTDIACSPACLPIVDVVTHRQGGGEDACYFVVRRDSAERVRDPHAERRFARKGSNSIVCSPPTLYTVRGEDRCYFVCNTRGRGFESRPASHAPVAQRIEHCPACRATCRLGSRQSPVPGPCFVTPVVKSAVTSGSQCRRFDSFRTQVRSSVAERVVALKGQYSLACSPAPFFDPSSTQERDDFFFESSSPSNFLF